MPDGSAARTVCGIATKHGVEMAKCRRDNQHFHDSISEHVVSSVLNHFACDMVPLASCLTPPFAQQPPKGSTIVFHGGTEWCCNCVFLEYIG